MELIETEPQPSKLLVGVALPGQPCALALLDTSCAPHALTLLDGSPINTNTWTAIDWTDNIAPGGCDARFVGVSCVTFTDGTKQTVHTWDDGGILYYTDETNIIIPSGDIASVSVGPCGSLCRGCGNSIQGANHS